MTIALQSLEEFRKVNCIFPYAEPVRQWKEQGKKVVGWSCIYVPQEIIYAAGMLPFRVLGDSREMPLDEANHYLSTNACSFTRSCFQLAITKQFDFLDGFVPCATCNCEDRFIDVWEHYIPIPVIHFLDVPRINNKRSLDFFIGEVSEFKLKLEQSFNVEISDRALREAIDTYNKSRELLQILYDLRKLDEPPISGAEVMEVLNAGWTMPRNRFNELLEQLISEIKKTGRCLKGSFRLMVSGSLLNNPLFIKTIEDLGPLVVVDELCTGTRYWTGLVKTDDSIGPVAALSERYLNVAPCARSFPVGNRINNLLQLAKDYRVDGVITEVIRNCATYGHEQPVVRCKLDEEGIPLLELTVEYGTPGGAQIRTRVEAFVEILEGRRQEK